MEFINVSQGGVPKRAVAQARIGFAGVEGDRQRDLRYHGGPDRAVCLFAMERIEALQAQGHPVFPGALGENLSVRGLDWSSMVPGLRLRVGDAELELTKPANPCKNLTPYFLGGDFTLVSAKLHPGWSRFYGRVLREGVVTAGASVEIDSSV